MSGILMAIAISGCVSQFEQRIEARETVIYRCPKTVTLIYRDFESPPETARRKHYSLEADKDALPVVKNGAKQ